MMRKCEYCGEDITDLEQHPYARRCVKCRYICSRKQRPANRCRRCGGEITDLDTHWSAELCLKCRNQAGRLGFDIRDKYQPMVQDYLNKHGWPTYTNARKLVAMYPGILDDGCPEINTQKRKQQIIAGCIRDIHDQDDRHYTVYNTQQYVLTEATV